MAEGRWRQWLTAPGKSSPWSRASSTNLKNEIFSLKEKYNKLKEDFLLTKENLIYKENILKNHIEKELETQINIESEEEKNNLNLNNSS